MEYLAGNQQMLVQDAFTNTQGHSTAWILQKVIYTMMQVAYALGTHAKITSWKCFGDKRQAKATRLHCRVALYVSMDLR